MRPPNSSGYIKNPLSRSFDNREIPGDRPGIAATIAPQAA